MHTSHQITSTDFQFWGHDGGKQQIISFNDVFPNYHELDRIGVVSPKLEDGILHTGRILLALTTAFYDSHRARSANFFDYPQHFAFVDVMNANLANPSTWDAWGWLDVWPDNKWVSTELSTTAMLQRVFDYQINRLFWPAYLKPQPNEARLPDYAYKMLRTRLKSVYYYGQSDSNNLAPCFSVSTLPAAEKMWRESIARLPTTPSCSISTSDHIQAIEVDDFVTMLG